MSRSTEDQALRDYLSGDTTFSRRYRAIEADEVPPELDRAVLAEAAKHDGAATPNRSRKLLFWRQMGAPMTLAASVVLVVSMVINRDRLDESLPIQNAEVQGVPESAMPLTKATESGPTLDTTSTPQVSSPATPLAAATTRQVPDSASVLSHAPASTSVAESATFDEVVVAEQRRSESLQDVPLSVEVFTPEKRAAESAPATAIDLNRNAQSRSSATRAPALEEIAVTAQKRENRNAGMGPRSTVPPSSPEYESTADIIRQREADPHAWLTYIRELRNAGQSHTANREWRNFVKAYPNYPVAADDRARHDPPRRP